MAITFTLDPAHTDVVFAARHMMVTTVRGKFHDIAGELELDEADPTATRGEIRIVAASLNTGVGPRDAHLRSGDFLDAEQYPEIVFRATGLEARGGERYAITGELTIRDTTRPVTFDAELLGFYTGMDGARRVGVHARTTINRKDWGLGWNVALESGGWLVSEDVRIEIDLAASEIAAPAREDAAA